MGQYEPLGERFHQPSEPFVRGRCLDDHLEGRQLGEEFVDPLFVQAGESPAVLDSPARRVLDHHANADTVLMEVDADVVHGNSPSVEIGDTTPPVYHALEGSPSNSRVGLLLHSFTWRKKQDARSREGDVRSKL